MKTVVITGSARGLGLEMAKIFRVNDFNIVLSDINEVNLKKAVELIQSIEGSGTVCSFPCDVSKLDQVEALWNSAVADYSVINIWVNNAGVNQPSCYSWELSENQIQLLLDVDLKGTVNGTNVAVRNMLIHGSGAVYNVEGFGSNGAYQDYLGMYGTTKRAVTYFTQATAKELNGVNKNIILGRLSPGIMITDFITSQAGSNDKIELSDKVKKVYNILGDYPNVVADFLVNNMIKNTKNDAHIQWLTNGKAFKRFIFAGFNKRDFFN